MLRVAIYTRVSTDDQAEEGYSLEAQMERLEAYCEAQGWEVAEKYVDDGFSGRSVKRPAYQRMMDERDRWDAILVMKMDRIHRNSKNFMVMMENLERWGKQFMSMQEELDTSSAMGRFVVDIIQRLAQLESEQIGERTYSGMAQKAESGGMLGLFPPFGYRVKDKELVVVEEEAEVVRDLYRRYCAGETMADLAESLNKHGIRTRKGNRWTLYSVRHILHNPIYAGFRRWDGILVRSKHPSIIDVKLFNDAQLVAADRTKDPRFKSASTLPL
ncbi:MAG TPA: recombinase family protein [Methanomassiliicoccaceae archaeon]|jgi:DNA invertase Pin-like site-specific DNA recombinase|nr:recombinase family protein [Methanomassiliicoccaceae archaeon]HOL08288.1 recombinase family protein [Methanomassiliicoccaceae archaeon]HOQ26616.1 recombinase family protein [Methanomassiliicoccaceae archaeon]HQD87819.1 recombinase family protein [Methanomassiliicoccaceae archaeon]